MNSLIELYVTHAPYPPWSKEVWALNQGGGENPDDIRIEIGSYKFFSMRFGKVYHCVKEPSGGWRHVTLGYDADDEEHREAARLVCDSSDGATDLTWGGIEERWEDIVYALNKRRLGL